MVEMSRRVVITGIGCLTPLGFNSTMCWGNLIAGKSGITPISSFDASNFPCHVAGEVKDHVVYTEDETVSQLPRAFKFLIKAVEEALADSHLSLSLKNSRVGGVIGVSSFDDDIEPVLSYYKLKKDNKLDSFYKGESFKQIKATYNNIMSVLFVRYAMNGPSRCIDTACSSSSQAIGEALRIIRNNEADIIITGGCSSLISLFGLTSFTLLGALSKSNISRPFDALRDGFILAEGAGIVILEELEHAIKRSAPIYAEVAGYGSTTSSYRITDSTPNGESEAKAIMLALRDGKFKEGTVSYVCAHGTSTKQNDWAETSAIKSVFREAAYSIPISSNKSQIGHTIAAAGALSTIFTALAIKNGLIPPTINYKNKDPICDLDYVPNEARQLRVESALVNAFAFGGHNTSILLRRV